MNTLPDEVRLLINSFCDATSLVALTRTDASSRAVALDHIALQERAARCCKAASLAERRHIVRIQVANAIEKDPLSPPMELLKQIAHCSALLACTGQSSSVLYFFLPDRQFPHYKEPPKEYPTVEQGRKWVSKGRCFLDIPCLIENQPTLLRVERPEEEKKLGYCAAAALSLMMSISCAMESLQTLLIGDCFTLFFKRERQKPILLGEKQPALH